MDLTASLDSLTLGDGIPNNIHNFAAVIGENHTDFLICYFQNCVKYIITQFGKIGNFYSVSVEKLENGVTSTHPVYNVTPLLGSDDINIEVGVRYITEKLKIQKPVIISLTLKDYKVETLNAVIEAIQNYPSVI